MLVRLQHLYATGDDTHLSTPATVDLASFLTSAGVTPSSTEEMALDGMRPVHTACQRSRYPAARSSAMSGVEGQGDGDVHVNHHAHMAKRPVSSRSRTPCMQSPHGSEDSVVMDPFDLRTFKVSRS